MARKTIDLENTGFFVPPHTRGDREFRGNGPIISISTRIFVARRRRIRARIWMRFMENQWDWTTSSGTYRFDVYDGVHDNVERINYIHSPGVSSSMRYEQVTGHGAFTRPEDRGPVREYYIVGDTSGSEAGFRTGAEIRFRPITIDFEPPEEPGDHLQVTPDVIEYIPPHTAGDRDFNGHARIWCNVDIRVRNRAEIWAEVYMRAREPSWDWTTAEGTETFRIYTHDTPIAEILSDTSSSVYYQDSDWEEDIMDMGAGELVDDFVFVGDTRGPEAGRQTGVIINFNPITIREEA